MMYNSGIMWKENNESYSSVASTEPESESDSIYKSQRSSNYSFQFDGDSSSSSFFSRRLSRQISNLSDDTTKPLAPERERFFRSQTSKVLESANLRFSQLGLIGREQEVAVLRSAFGRARGRVAERNAAKEAQCDGNSRDGNASTFTKELVLISGPSGCGKTKLACTLSDRVEKSGGLFVRGKYDLYFRDEPYFGISQACDEILGQIFRLKESGDEDDAENFDKICDALRNEIGDNLHILTKIMPRIVEIMDEKQKRESGFKRLSNRQRLSRQSENSMASTGSFAETNLNLEQSREQFNFIFRKFIRVITSVSSILGKSLVIMLDDLQWADVASFELLELLLTDRESSGLMVVGCYRSEEMTHAQILSKIIPNSVTMERARSQQLFTISELKLDELSTVDVNAYLMELLSIDDNKKTLPLANLCHKRTMGNPFHLRIFLQMLQEERLLELNVGMFCWTFDIEKIMEKTSAAFNVVDMVTSQLQRVSEPLQELLLIAACLGSSFESETLFMIWNKMNVIFDENELDVYLKEAEDKNILETERDSMTRFRWTHDKVKEATMILGSRTSDDIQLQVGLLLLEIFEENVMDDSTIFVIANLLNCEKLSSLNAKKREEIAYVHLEAAKEAVACSAFKSAAKYVKNGVALLPSNAFTNNYNLALELFSVGAGVEGCIGNSDQMQYYCGEVFLHSANSLDKIRCYKSKLLWLGNSKRTKMACDLCLDILDELGICKIPRGKLLQSFEAVVALKKIKEIEPVILNDLPLMTEPTALATMSILNSLFTYAHLSGQSSLLVIASRLMYRQTMKYGLCSLSTTAITNLAILKSTMGNFGVARKLCDHAITLLPKFASKEELARTYFRSYCIVKPWTMPCMSCLKYLQAGYQAGLECGDTESASWNIIMYLRMRMLAGANLNSVIADFQTYLPQAQEFGNEHQALLMTIYLQQCLCLVGLSGNLDNPTEISGEMIPDAKEFEDELRSYESKLSLLCYGVQKSFLCTIFGDHEQGAKLALERDNDDKLLSQAYCPFTADTFRKGISLFEMARRTKKKKYTKASKKMLSYMRSWNKSGNPNVTHTLAILEAENFALSGDRERACRTYEKSITLSSLCGWLHDTALAHERYGEYLVNEINNKEKALYHFGKALDCYREWGATAKVEHMMKQNPDLQRVPSKIEISQ